jgi:RNA polymerase sigma-B factor
MPCSTDDARLARRHRGGDAEARELLVARYLPFARSLARRYMHAGEPLDDLYQVASIGLLKAIDRWDPDHGSRFTAFAAPTVLGELRRHFRDTTWAIRPPRSVQELSLRIERTRNRWQETGGRDATVIQLADRLRRDPGDVAEALQAHHGRVPESLYAPLPGLQPTVADAVGLQEPGYDHVERTSAMAELVGTLDGRTREILRLRFEEDLTQTEIGARVGLSQAHVGRILTRTLDQLSQEPSARCIAA